jgi:hypothetical protein
MCNDEASEQTIRCSIPGRDKKFLCSPKSPDRFFGLGTGDGRGGEGVRSFSWSKATVS